MSGMKWDNSARHRAESAVENVRLTPPWLVDRIRQDIFDGVIDLDPATTPDNPVGATRFVCLPDDGILAPWTGRVFCNPPYGGTSPQWVEKCITTMGGGNLVVLLVPARTETRWFQRALAHAHDVLLFSRRLKFSKDALVRETVNATFPSALFGFGVSLEPLQDLGTIIRPVRGVA